MEATYPKAGPRNGAMRNILVTTALCLGRNRSAFVPAPTANAGLPVRPARNRHMMSDARLLENPAPSVKSMNMGEDVMYTILRPCFSLNGAEMMGPKPRPSV
jgi:hypothetical protein